MKIFYFIWSRNVLYSKTKYQIIYLKSQVGKVKNAFGTRCKVCSLFGTFLWNLFVSIQSYGSISARLSVTSIVISIRSKFYWLKIGRFISENEKYNLLDLSKLQLFFFCFKSLFLFFFDSWVLLLQSQSIRNKSSMNRPTDEYWILLLPCA